MSDYRLYFQDMKGHFLRAEAIDVTDDEAALAKARGINHEYGIEVWQGARLVGMVKAAEAS
jgi:hypothetical protein